MSGPQILGSALSLEGRNGESIPALELTANEKSRRRNCHRRAGPVSKRMVEATL